MNNDSIRKPGAEPVSSPELKKHHISTLTVFFMIFCMVSAGAYGIEDMLPASGPGLTIVLLIVLPFFWSIPQGLVASELGSAIPTEGGYYKWIQRALGEFWGFQGCWWRTLSIYVDSTLYIVLAADYMAACFPMSDLAVLLVKIGLIIVLTYINIRGVKDVGRIASFFSIIVIVTFAVMTVLGFMNWNYDPFSPFMPEGQTLLQSIGLGVAICMWMYSGYESMSTMAGEIKNPQVIPKATILSVPAIMLVYILPTIAGVAAVGHWDQWSTEGGISFATVASSLGLPFFGILFAIAAIVSNLSMYNTYLASGSRGFYSLAGDKLFPRFFADIHPKHGTPYKAILSMALVNLLLCQFGFDVLVIIDVFLLMFAYVLIYIAAIVLRIKEPDLKRPFRIPLGTKGLIALCVPPICLAVLALFTNGLLYFIGGCIGVVSGPVAYFIFKKKYGGMSGEHKSCKRGKTSGIILCVVMTVIIIVAGVMVGADRSEAHEALEGFRNDYLLSQDTGKIGFDWGEELYNFSVTDSAGFEYQVYYDGGFYAYAYLDDYYSSGEEFAADAYQVLQILGRLPFDYVNIESGQYCCRETAAADYSSPQELLTDISRVF